MVHVTFRFQVLVVVCAIAAAASAGAQPGVQVPSTNRVSTDVRRLTVDEAVRLALEQNLGIQVERLNPQMEDLTIARSRAAWSPTLTADVGGASTDTPVTNTFAGGQDRVTDTRFDTTFGITQRLPTGAEYGVSWSNTRATSTNFFNNFEPELRSSMSLAVSQPLLRNFKIDDVRQRMETGRQARDRADMGLEATIAQTARAVRNAYWDLSASISRLDAVRQSLQLADRLLADNQRRVQVGTMAALDIVEAQAEVARNQEAVIVAEAEVEDAEDRLRVLVFDPDAPDFWTLSVEPADAAPFAPRSLDVDGAIRRAVESRTDVRQARNSISQIDISLRYFRNQTLPEVNAQATYGLVGVGGTELQPLTSFPLGGIPPRPVVDQRGFNTVLGDVLTAAYPAWTVGVQIGYPVGRSPAQADLARARLQHTQAQTSLRLLELQVASQVREAARRVDTNAKRVDSARVARELAERRLQAEEKKLAAGIQTAFFVFQAQRDLTEARTNEVRAIADYTKSVVDFEAVQQTPLP